MLCFIIAVLVQAVLFVHVFNCFNFALNSVSCPESIGGADTENSMKIKVIKISKTQSMLSYAYRKANILIHESKSIPTN